MSEPGPSWWRTKVATASPASGDESETRFYLLFEFFSRNARQHETLRASLSDGAYAWEGTYSHDEIFAENGFSRRSDEVSRRMREVVDEEERGLVCVETYDDSARRYVIVVQLDGPGSESVRLELKVEIQGKTFVDRVASYLKHVEIRLKSAQDDLETGCTRRGELQTQVEAAVKAKQEEDRKMEIGMALLMTEKRNHWK